MWLWLEGDLNRALSPEPLTYSLNLSTCYWTKRQCVAQEITNSVCGLCVLVDFS
jgi:hypothetical protein